MIIGLILIPCKRDCIPYGFSVINTACPLPIMRFPSKATLLSSLDLYVWAYDISCPNCDCDSGSSRDEVNIDLLYSSLFNENALPVKNGFYFNFGFTPWLPIHRNFNLGFSPGIYYGFNQLDNSFNNDGEEIKKQRYSNIGLSLEAKARIAFFNTKKYWTYGPFLDFGALYKLPFAFRYVQIGEAVRTRYNDLHNFQDFRLFAKLGFTPVSVRVDYRLNDFIKSTFAPATSLEHWLEFCAGSVGGYSIKEIFDRTKNI
jgi:hypothetical protein